MKKHRPDMLPVGETVLGSRNRCSEEGVLESLPKHTVIATIVAFVGTAYVLREVKLASSPGAILSPTIVVVMSW